MEVLAPCVRSGLIKPLKESEMTIAQRLADFASQASHENLSEKGSRQFKLLVLDTIGCAIGSLGAAPINNLCAHGDRFGGAPLCTLIGVGRTALDLTND